MWVEWKKVGRKNSTRVNEIVTLLRLCLVAIFVCFRNKYYQQTVGIAMGSPVSVTVANLLVMEEIEETALSTFYIPQCFWKRYMCCCSQWLGVRVTSISEYNEVCCMNTYIQFTMKQKEEGYLWHTPDTQSGWLNRYISTQKEDSYWQILEFHITPWHTRDRLFSLPSKGWRSCPQMLYVSVKEEVYIGRALWWIGYPRRFVNRTTNRCQRKKFNEGEGEKDEPTATAMKEYVRGTSEAIERMLERVNVRVRLRSCRTLRQFLMKPKDKVPVEERTRVVVQSHVLRLPFYVGQLGCTLECQKKEHRRATEKEHSDSSVIVEHTWKLDHRINWK